MRASLGSTLWCNQPRQAPHVPDHARRVPHRFHWLPAEKPLVEQGLPEPGVHRPRSCQLSTWSSSPHLQRRISSTTPQSPPGSDSAPFCPTEESDPIARANSSASWELLPVLPNRPWVSLRKDGAHGERKKGAYFAPCRNFPGWDPGAAGGRRRSWRDPIQFWRSAALADSSKRVCPFSLCPACPPALVWIALAPLVTEALTETNPL